MHHSTITKDSDTNYLRKLSKLSVHRKNQLKQIHDINYKLVIRK